METTTNNTGKQTNSNKSVSKSGSKADIGSLLNGDDFGLRLRGMVVSVGEARIFTGENSNGTKYTSETKSFDVACGDRVISCAFRKKDPSDSFPNLNFGEVIEVNVDYCRAVSGKISVSGELVNG